MVHRRSGLESVLPNVSVGILTVEQMQREEQRAVARRLGAEAALMDAFETAGQELAALWQTGDYSPQEALIIEGRLRELDPMRSSTNPDPTWIADRFSMLLDGEPAYDLHIEGGSRYSGIVKGEPSDFTVVPPRIYRDGTITSSYSPYTRFNIPLFITSFMREQTVELSGYTLRYGLIGREAIAQAVNDASFEKDDFPRSRLSPQTNYADLKNLREFVKEIFEEGIEPFDTAPLDEALDEADRYRQSNLPSARPAMHFPYGPLGSASKHL